jgi:hypothetical protein
MRRLVNRKALASYQSAHFTRIDGDHTNVSPVKMQSMRDQARSQDIETPPGNK